ncbi:branched-chain amino acid ABC transporter permease [Brockia lithotrophica]|uniref:Amino acid/amide ABC transporter membrane protein 2 (HAAT family) n=1 Tax=Brockia lithotrophica TaxID=933949 RepID=A0A660KUM3_9BACL|nr:branched-chain amino acid ABC transporter permease [Brockia lithotrophica]RKQ84683.1 amino acid/amide ABC transporter membrane protein 2 (HAAT family) [Brockia lithotrophica]
MGRPFEMRSWTRVGGVLLALLVGYGVVELALRSGWIGRYGENVLMAIGINILLAVSLHVILGLAGQFSIGQAGFLAVGAYTAAVVTTRLDMPFELALVAGVVVSVLMGLLVGLPTLRLRGDYLAIATLGFAEIVRISLLNFDYVGGAAGMQLPHLTTWTHLFVSLVLVFTLVLTFTHSAYGRATLAVREDEIAAEAMGISPTFVKVFAFAFGAGIAGLAGGLYAHTFYVIQPVDFGFLKSFEILVFVVLGGIGSLSGATLAAVLLTILSTYLQQFPEIRMILYSVVLILIMLFRPQGLLGDREFGDLLSVFRPKKGADVR